MDNKKHLMAQPFHAPVASDGSAPPCSSGFPSHLLCISVGQGKAGVTLDLSCQLDDHPLRWARLRKIALIWFIEVGRSVWVPLFLGWHLGLY